ncbi:hypothetical protein GUITHDRAFT_101000 [Guillardia theta CCMP2712]|uniref:At4g15545-like C-terminal domain-containing protein n=1 Tax=Guillardia theta (strain CCMP2712) TaxID=905079 RepID=L1JXL7_GUITC|nr:hypothetical protein GUITHDRAFT_101000 [Guillardia theta CCMP2712]EKX53296.1 hypothetical protein GUITHDRAFT_101000 [Guillardia theta CCMP2712]|eukprot:XP_005840276.1 hypothetical protein GUITHDRAFT_101000 [Guillardia theta CCMP2712]
MDGETTADGQMQLGLQMVQQAYGRRAEELTREVEHWKRVAQHHKQQEAQTREELNKANQRSSELQRQLSERQQEIAQLTEARNVALNQIATLKKHASQLQSFKKNISNMLQADTGLDTLNVQGMLDNLPPMDSTFNSSSIPSPSIDLMSKPSTSMNFYNGNVDAFPGASGMGYPSGNAGYPHAGANAMPKSTPQASSQNAAPEITMDAATYYQQVKRVLEPEQFREFSANIKRLNAGQQSVDETLERVREIFGEHRPFLFAQLQKLIRQVPRKKLVDKEWIPTEVLINKREL